MSIRSHRISYGRHADHDDPPSLRQQSVYCPDNGAAGLDTRAQSDFYHRLRQGLSEDTSLRSDEKVSEEKTIVFNRVKFTEQIGNRKLTFRFWALQHAARHGPSLGLGSSSANLPSHALYLSPFRTSTKLRTAPLHPRAVPCAVPYQYGTKYDTLPTPRRSASVPLGTENGTERKDAVLMTIGWISQGYAFCLSAFTPAHLDSAGSSRRRTRPPRASPRARSPSLFRRAPGGEVRRSGIKRSPEVTQCTFPALRSWRRIAVAQFHVEPRPGPPLVFRRAAAHWCA